MDEENRAASQAGSHGKPMVIEWVTTWKTWQRQDNGTPEKQETEKERLIQYERLWKIWEISAVPLHLTLPLMLMMYNLSCYKGRTYHIELHSGYWSWHCNLNAVNHNDCRAHCNARQTFCFNGFRNALGLWHVAGPRTERAFWLFHNLIPFVRLLGPLLLLLPCFLNNGLS